jgi:hypothetical protein
MVASFDPALFAELLSSAAGAAGLTVTSGKPERVVILAEFLAVCKHESVQ